MQVKDFEIGLSMARQTIKKEGFATGSKITFLDKTARIVFTNFCPEALAMNKTEFYYILQIDSSFYILENVKPIKKEYNQSHYLVLDRLIKESAEKDKKRG
jgi:hypothetical protein